MSNKRVVPFRYPVFLTNVLLGVAFSIYILFPGMGGYETIQTGKFELFVMIFGGYLAVMALLTIEVVWINRIRLPNPRLLWKKASFVEKAIFAYWFMTLISTLLSPYGQGAIVGLSRNEGFLTQTIYCGTFLCVSFFARPKAWMLQLFSVVMTVFCIICLLQMQGYNPLGLYPAGTNYFGANQDYPGIYLGTTGNADLTAALLCLAIPMLAIWLILGKKRYRFCAVVPLTLCVFTLIQSDVKAGLVGVVCGMTLILPVVLPVQTHRKKWLWLTFGIAVAAGILYGYFNQRTWGVAYEIREILHGNWDVSFGTGRIGIWKEVLQLSLNRFFLGYGPDTMAAAQISHYSRVIDGVNIPLIIDVAHNEYLNILYHQGIFALLPYLIALVISFVQWIKVGHKNIASAICGSAVVCYGIQAFFGFSMCQTSALFWLAWAILNNCSREERSYEGIKTISQH